MAQPMKQNHLCPVELHHHDPLATPPDPPLISAPVDPCSDHTLDGSVDIRGRPVKKSRTGGWKASSFIIGDELSERIAYYGIASNLITYLTVVLHEGLATSIRNTNNWLGVTLVVPVIGAFFADGYWGRYLTVAIVSVVYVVGLVFLTLSVSLPSLKPPRCVAITKPSSCPKATSAQLGFFFFSLYLVSVGTGGVKPCLEAFGADQFDEEDPVERKEKSSFFNWWYFGLCTGGLFAVTVLVYIEENVSWGLGFGIPAGAMAIACVLFFVGTPLYRHKLPQGSPLTHIAQVLVAAVRKWNVKVPEDKSLLHEARYDASEAVGRRQLLHTPQMAFLDKAAVEVDVGDAAAMSQNPWRLSTVTRVEEVKLVLRVVPVWLTTFAYGVVFAQSGTLFTKQASTMDRRIGPNNFKFPAASMQATTAIVVLLSLPIYDRVFVPIARKVTGNERGITLLQRIGAGLLLSVLCMVAAAMTETKRLKEAKNQGLVENPKGTIAMTVFWLLPQYILLGVADLLTLVGQQEFFYDQVPDSMRSLGMALYLSAVGVGSFISSLLITVVNSVSRHTGSRQEWIVDNLNKCKIDYYYWFLAVLSSFNLIAFLCVAKSYKYKKVKSSCQTTSQFDYS